ncbi:hypothetical protein HZC09_06600 [Candidatus Micrarchaeota archaeon]|nr:hypothetical protein [Candidatus Micrarchaeota archaeon]
MDKLFFNSYLIESVLQEKGLKAGYTKKHSPEQKQEIQGKELGLFESFRKFLGLD